ncbi:hypothetical protein [Nocardia alni]|uniref:hypothetical protein n=1 Tax=Nocardia alni TaxID=2815723 RepID=UPI001C211025|nr:hypothetical protein [Nocardia alni]
MRPSPSEVVAGIRAILAETIAPELTSEHARSRLAEIRAVLAQIDWDDAGFTLASRSDELARCLGAAGECIDGVSVPGRPSVANFESYQRHYDQLAGLAVEVLRRLRVHLDERPDDEAARAAYRTLLTAV